VRKNIVFVRPGKRLPYHLTILRPKRCKIRAARKNVISKDPFSRRRYPEAVLHLDGGGEVARSRLEVWHDNMRRAKSLLGSGRVSLVLCESRLIRVNVCALAGPRGVSHCGGSGKLSKVCGSTGGIASLCISIPHC